jgi:hypothetical protein
MEQSLWYCLAYFATTTRGAIIFLIITVVLTFPIIVGIYWFRIVDDMSMVFVPSLPCVTALDAIQRYFPPGTILPIHVTANTTNPNGTFTDTYFSEATDFITKLISDTDHGIDATSVVAMPWLAGYSISFPDAVQLNATIPDYRYLRTRVEKDLNTSAHPATMILFTSFNPATAEFMDF